jgi:hypothetical protein
MMKDVGDLPQNVNFAVELQVLKNFLLQQHVPFEQAVSGHDIAPADIGDRARLLVTRLNVRL